jgi:GST-like protein
MDCKYAAKGAEMRTNMSQPIEIYYWPTPNGHKVTIACEEMGLPYEIKPVNIGRGEQFTPEFQALSPNGRMPAIVDPDGPGGQPISVFESGAILQYLGRKTGQFYPEDERARVKVDEWVFWQMGGLGPMAGQRNHFRNYAPSFIHDQRQVAYGAIRYTNEVNRLYGVMDKQLDGRDFLAGDYSIADMISWPWVAARSSSALELEEFPNLLAWQKRVDARPAVQRAMAKARDFAGSGLQGSGRQSEEARKVLFGQRARR